MKRMLLAVGFLLLTLGLSAGDQLTVASDVWSGFVNQNGTGSYPDILKEIFTKNGITFKLVLLNYDKSKEMLAQGKADAVLGAYADEIKGKVLYPEWHIDCDVIEVLYVTGKQTWQGEPSLNGKKVGWQKGFDMDVMLTQPVQRVEVNGVNDGLVRLKAGAIDFYIDERSLIQENIKETPAMDMAPFTRAVFNKKKIYAVFSPAAERFAKLWDREMIKLVRNGKLKEIYVKWGMMKADESITHYYQEGAH